MRWNFCQHSTGTAPRQHVPAFQGRSQVPSPEQRHPASRDGLAGEHRQEGTGSSTGRRALAAAAQAAPHCSLDCRDPVKQGSEQAAGTAVMEGAAGHTQLLLLCLLLAEWLGVYPV